jgi:hypothetical protein
MTTPDPICSVCLRPIRFGYATLGSAEMAHVRCADSLPAGRRSRRRKGRWLILVGKALLPSAWRVRDDAPAERAQSGGRAA